MATAKTTAVASARLERMARINVVCCFMSSYFLFSVSFLFAVGTTLTAYLRVRCHHYVHLYQQISCRDGKDRPMWEPSWPETGSAISWPGRHSFIPWPRHVRVRGAPAITKLVSGTRKSEKDFGEAKAAVRIDKQPFLAFGSTGMLRGGQFIDPISLAVVMSMQSGLSIPSYQRRLRVFL